MERETEDPSGPESGWTALTDGRYQHAHGFFTAALRSDGADEAAQVGLMAALRRLGRFPEAEDAYRKVAQAHHPRLPFERAWLYADEGKPERALPLFESILARDPKNEEALKGRIASLRKQRRYGEAQQALDAALKDHPDSIEFLSEQAWLYVEQHQPGQARSAFDAVLEKAEEELKKTGKNPVPERELEQHTAWKVFMQVEERDLDGALKNVDAALERFSMSTTLLDAHGWVRFYRQEYPAALKSFEAVLEKDTNNESALQGRIATLRSMGRLHQAERAWKLASKRQPSSPGIAAERGWIALARGRYAQAQDAFRKVVALREGDPRPRVDLASALIQDKPGDLEEAEEQCREALRLDEWCAEAYACLGAIAARRHDVRQAEENLLRSIELHPASRTHADLAALYIESQRYRKARVELRRARKIDPHDANAAMQLGSLYLRTDRPYRAARAYHRAVELARHEPDAHAGLATALMESVRYDEAEKVLRGAIERLDHTGVWKLHLLLSQLFVRQGDNGRDPKLYDEALKQGNIATALAPREGAPHFHAGIAWLRLEEYDDALKSFRRCRNVDPENADALVQEQRVLRLVHKEHERSRVGRGESWLLAAFFLACFITIWVLRYTSPGGTNLDNSVLLTMSTVLLGLALASRMLPWLTRIKFSGFEAELQAPAPRETLASGPRGEVDFSRTAI